MDNENKEKVSYWLDLAEYDLDTAKAMLKSRRYLYVGFMCHQVIEKALKACAWFFLEREPEYRTRGMTILSTQEIQHDA